MSLSDSVVSSLVPDMVYSARGFVLPLKVGNDLVTENEDMATRLNGFFTSVFTTESPGWWFVDWLLKKSFLYQILAQHQDQTKWIPGP